MTRRTREKLAARRWVREVVGDGAHATIYRGSGAPLVAAGTTWLWLRRSDWTVAHLLSADETDFAGSLCGEVREKDTTVWLEGQAIMKGPKCVRCERLALEVARCGACGLVLGPHGPEHDCPAAATS